MKRLLIIAAGVLALMGCEKQGPVERFGEEVDESVEDVRSGGETLGNRLDDAADDVRNAAEDAADELRR